MDESGARTSARRRWWPLLLGLVAVLAFAWLVAEVSRREQPTAAPPMIPAVRQPAPASPPSPEDGPPPVSEADVSEAVDAFVLFSRAPAAAGDASAVRHRTVEGTFLLSHALDAMVARTRDAHLEERRDKLRQQAAMVQQQLAHEGHAATVRTAARSAAELMAALAKRDAGKSPPALSDVRSAARDIQPAVPLAQQSDAVEDFFARSAEVLVALGPSME